MSTPFHCEQCRAPYDREQHTPRSLPCMHSLCHACCHAEVSTSNRCPICFAGGKQVSLGVSSAEELPATLALMTHLPSPAVAVPTEENKDVNAPVICKPHSSSMSKWCADCRELVCEHCTQYGGGHYNHKVQTLTSAGETSGQAFVALLAKTSTTYQQLQDREREVTEQRRAVEDAEQEVSRALSATALGDPRKKAGEKAIAESRRLRKDYETILEALRHENRALSKVKKEAEAANERWQFASPPFTVAKQQRVEELIPSLQDVLENSTNALKSPIPVPKVGEEWLAAEGLTVPLRPRTVSVRQDAKGPRLSWAHPLSKLTAYEVQHGEEHNGEVKWATSERLPAVRTTLSLKDVKTGTSSLARIRALNLVGAGPWEIIHFKTDDAATKAEKQLSRGKALRYGLGIPADATAALEMFQLAAEQNAEAQCELGTMYEEGLAVEQPDVGRACEQYAKAAAAGRPRGQYLLSRLLWGEHPAEAGRLLTAAANSGFRSALRELGRRYLVGEGFEQNREKGVGLLKEAIKQGDAAATEVLGQHFLERVSVSKDPHEEVAAFRIAAAHGYGKAQYLLGVCYARGTGVEKDAKEAVKWYSKAAQQQVREAQFELARCYELGLGVPPDPLKADLLYAEVVGAREEKAEEAWKELQRLRRTTAAV